MAGLWLWFGRLLLAWGRWRERWRINRYLRSLPRRGQR